MRTPMVVLLFLAACSKSPQPVSSLTRAATTCTVPGATPNDGLDDRLAIQAALDAQGCAYLPPGTYDVDTPVVTPPARRLYMMLTVGAAGSLYGDGPAAILRFRGDAAGQDWQGIRLGGDEASVRSLTIDTSGLVNTDEQTHAIHVLGPVNGVSVSRVRFVHPQRGSQLGGDCIQLVGYAPDRLITGMAVSDNDFAHCDRSGVAIHSGAVNLSIADNRFIDTGDQDIDGEGTGDSTGWLIIHNTFEVGLAPQGANAIQLQLTTSSRITDNVLNGRGIFLYQSSGIEVDHNAITRSLSGDSAGVIEVEKNSSGINIHHNTLTRAATAGPGYVVRASPHGSGTPDHVTIADNALIQQSTGHVIDTTGLVGLNVTHNTVTYSGAATMQGINAVGGAGADLIRTTDLVVVGNIWRGPLKGIVQLSGSYGGAGSLTMSDNLTNGALTGMSCINFGVGAKVTGPVTSSRDSMPTPACGPPGWVTVTP